MVKMKNKEEKITEVLNAKATASVEEAYAEQKKVASEKVMVTVACGIPMGLKLELSDGTLVLKGMPISHIVNARDGGYLPAGKYGLTPVTEAQWDEILAKYGKFDFILNGIVFAAKEEKEAVEKAVELSETKRTGFEQADPKKGKTKKSKVED